MTSDIDYSRHEPIKRSRDRIYPKYTYVQDGGSPQECISSP